MKFENHTPFSHGWLVLLDKQAAENLIIALKATYNISEEGKLELAKKQEPVRAADEFYGDPGKSSIHYEAELGPAKPRTDVVLVGSAVAPIPGSTQMDVALRVGQLFKQVKVFGERRWKWGLFGLSISKPLPFDRIPLTYENAYGGKDTSARNTKHHGQEPRNPVGRGYQAKKSKLRFAGTLLPNIEDPERLIRRPGAVVVPQGFGFIGRDWQPRLKYVGTYDQKWMEERLPLLPLDFDERFHNAATPDLIAPGYLIGNEIVGVNGCSRSGRIVFTLPGLKPSAGVTFDRGHLPVTLNLSTILLDMDAMRLYLLWKGVANIHHRLPQLNKMECRLS